MEQNNHLNNNQNIVFQQITHKFEKKSFLNLFQKQPGGFYIYGTVGSGKTFLLNELYKYFSDKKSFFHYHNFIIHIHNLLKGFKNKTNKIKLAAKEISKDHKYLFIDELEILDITDAMLIKDLVMHLNQYDTKVFFTTNIKPQDMYKDGIQRESFLPFIEYLTKNFQIFNLSSNTDLRFSKEKKNNQHFLFPNNNLNNKIIDEKLYNLSTGKLKKNGQIEINQNFFRYQMLAANLIAFDFVDLFETNSSIKDFEFITSHYPHVAIYNARKIKKEENNIIKRLINFIDLAYINKTNLFISSEIIVYDLYNEGQYSKKFKRCQSRLKEMGTLSYE